MHRGFANALAGDAGEDAPPRSTRPQVSPSLRSKGQVDMSFHLRAGRTALQNSAQSGCLRMRLPRPSNDTEIPCAVLLNTSGGIADGDRLDQRIAWGSNTVATVATQAAEKVYRALDSGSVVVTRIEVGAGARAEWLPQETILFDESRLRRDTQIRLAGECSYVGVEAVVLGRQAMGETVRRGALRDSMRIWREGRLVYADTLLLTGGIAEIMQSAAIGGGAAAMAIIILASSDAALLLDAVRDALGGARGRAAASSWNGLLAVRLLARDGESLRHDITAVLAVLCEGRPLPRVWRC